MKKICLRSNSHTFLMKSAMFIVKKYDICWENIFEKKKNYFKKVYSHWQILCIIEIDNIILE